MPDLPKGNYDLWVRGYGLIDSPKVTSEPGKIVNLKSVPAPDAKAAAQYYPAIYWYSMLKMPDASQFGPKGIPVKQYEYISLMKNNGCVGCHQLGTLATRTIPAVFGTSSKDAWMQRTQAGQAGELMVNIIAGQLQAAPLGYLADWTDRIAKGELPHATPKRPEGVERNVVVTTYDWSDQQHYLHDLSATDKRNPTVNGYGHLYGQPEYSMDAFPVLDLQDRNGHAASGAAPRRGHARDARTRARRHGEAARAVGLLGRGEDLDRPLQQSQRDHGRQRPRVDDGRVPRPA